MKGVKNNKIGAKTIFLNSIGAETYELLKIVAVPEEISNLSYKQVIEILKDQLVVKSNIIVERHRFLFKKKQNLNESINTYENELKKIVLKCKFSCELGKSVSDIFLLSQLEA